MSIHIQQAKSLITRWEEGDIDNAAEGFQEAMELLEVLPDSEKALRESLEEISTECSEILAEVYGE